MSKNSKDFTNLDQVDDAQHWVRLMRIMTELFPSIIEIRQCMLGWITQAPGTYNNILDGGCGPGDTTRQIAQHVSADTNIIGIDFSEVMLEFAKSQNNASNIRFQTGDLTSLPFDDGYFDAVRVERVLHHVPEAEKALAEVFRVLKPGGRFVINEPDFTLTRLFPLPIELSREYAQQYSDSVANGAIGSRLHALMQAIGFVVQHHQGIMYIGKDFKRIDASFEAIQLLRDLLEAKDRPELMSAVEAAAQQGTFYWAPVSFMVMAEKPT